MQTLTIIAEAATRAPASPTLGLLALALALMSLGSRLATLALHLLKLLLTTAFFLLVVLLVVATLFGAALLGPLP